MANARRSKSRENRRDEGHTDHLGAACARLGGGVAVPRKGRVAVEGMTAENGVLLKLLLLWGPLSLGWVVAWLLWQELRVVQRELRAALERNTLSAALLATRLVHAPVQEP